MQNVNIHILNASGKLDELPYDPQKQIRKASEEVSKYLQIHDVDITFGYSQEVIPETGWMGTAYDGLHLIDVMLDPENDNALRNPEIELLGTLAHELHHAMRFQAGHHTNTLLDNLVAEGLASKFERAITDNQIERPWTHALDAKQKSHLWKKAKEEFYDEDYDHHEWFLNFLDEGMPKWTGYTLGYDLVRVYIEDTGKTAAELVDRPTESFVDYIPDQ